MSERSFFAELKRRNVWRAAVFYAAGAWLIAQVAGLLLPAFHAEDWVLRWIVIAMAIGFPLWLLFAWFYEITPEGIKRESEVEAHESITPQTGRKLDRWIFAIMALAIVLLLTDRFVLRRGVNQQAAVAISEKSIAVLPFADMSQAKDQEYFSDGISEELLNQLSKVPALHVAARTSSFSFKGKDAPIPEIARTLLVAHVLEGSIRKSGDQVRITAQLIRAADGYHLWSETYDRKLDDIFAIQDEISAKVVEQLKVTLLGAAPKARSTDPKAYALHLQAVQLGRQFTPEGFKQSDALFQQVLAIDSRYAPAWTELARNLVNESIYGLLPSRDAFERARAAAQQALSIDPDYAPASAALGFIASLQNDPAAAARHYGRALALDPTDPDVLGTAFVLLQTIGRVDEALVVGEATLRRDPLNVKVHGNLAIARLQARRYDDAIASARAALSLSPRMGLIHQVIAAALLFKGDAAGALAEYELETSEVFRMIGVPMAYHALGRKADSDAALSALISKFGKDAPYNIACVHAYRGEADKAFDWLKKAVATGDPGLGDLAAENLFDNVRSDPRWLPFLRKIGRAPEQLAKIEFKVTLPAEWQAEAAAAAPGAAAKP